MIKQSMRKLIMKTTQLIAEEIGDNSDNTISVEKYRNNGKNMDSTTIAIL